MRSIIRLAAVTSAWRMAVVASTSTMIALSRSIEIICRVGEERLATMGAGPAGSRIGGRDELRRDVGCRAEGGIIEHRQILLDRPAAPPRAASPSSPSTPRCRLASALIRLASTAKPSPPTSLPPCSGAARSRTPPQQIALAEAAVPVLREGRVVGNSAVEPEPAEPAIGEVQMHLLAEPPLRADAEAVADDQHPDHQLGIDRWTPRRAVERREFPPHLRQIDEAVDRPQEMIRRHMRIEREVVEQRTRSTCRGPIIDSVPASNRTESVNLTPSQPASFSTQSALRRNSREG